MDLLSDAIAAMRTGRPHSARTHRSGSWAVRHPAFAGAGFHVVLQGTCRLRPEGGAPVTLGTGDAVFLPHGSAHELSAGPSAGPPVDPSVDPLTSLAPYDDAPAAGGDTIVMLCGAYLLDRTRLHPLMTELPELIHLPAQIGRHPSLRAAIDLLGAELERRRAGADAALSSLLDTLLVYMVRAWLEEEGPGRTGWATALRDPAVVAALGAVHGDPARHWTVEELGVRAGLSRAAFARRFTALVGRPPLAYLTWWRMTVAAGLLRDTDAPLGAVAARVGYSSEYAFANAFKREYGIAPGRYRRRDGTEKEPAAYVVS